MRNRGIDKHQELLLGLAFSEQDLVWNVNYLEETLFLPILIAFLNLS